MRCGVGAGPLLTAFHLRGFPTVQTSQKFLILGLVLLKSAHIPCKSFSGWKNICVCEEGEAVKGLFAHRREVL